MKRSFAAALLLVGVMGVPAASAARLPLDVTPTNYRITFTPDLAAEKFSGEEIISVQVKKPVTAITLHAVDIEFDDVTITSGKKSQKATVTRDAKEETATFTVASALPAGAAKVHIRYRGTLNDKLRGLYISKTKRRKYAATQFEPTDARRAFPSFDEPAMKATFDVAVVVDKDDTAISNGAIVSEKPGPAEGKKTITFDTSAKMSTYLVALLVGDFQCATGAADGIPIRVCAVPEKKDLTQYGVETAEMSLKYFNEYYSIKYPFKKLDVIALPDFEAGAMENTAAITFRESALLIKTNEASIGSRKGIASIMAHEVAHMWFGDLVTMKWWNDIWLNEGFATWAASKAVAAWKPEWNVALDEAQWTSGSLGTDSLESTRPIRARAETSAQINEMFDGIAYGKTAGVLRMLEAYVGEAKFRDGIRAYLKKYSYTNAGAEDFWTTLASATGKPIDKIMQSYVDQPGAPLITASARCEAGNTLLTLSQRRVFSDRKRFLAANDQTWIVPVTLRNLDSASDAPRSVLLSKKNETFTLPGCTPHLFINRQGRGFYRTAHAPEMLQVEKGPGAALSAAERVTLLTDSGNLVRLGERNIADHMALISTLGTERTRAVVEVILGTLSNIGLNLVTDANRPRYEAWVASYLRPLADDLGWDAKPGESDEDKQLRSSVIGTLGYIGNDQATLQRARSLAEKALSDPRAVDPSLMNVVFQLAAYSGDATWYDKLKSQLAQAKTPQEYYRYLFSLGAFRQPELHSRSLEYAISADMRNQDMPGFLGSLMGNPRSRDAAWQFVKEHWTDIQKKFTTWGGAGLVSSTGVLCDARAGEDVKQFFAQHPVPAAERGLKQALERIESSVAFRELQSQNLNAWLEKQPVAQASR